MPSANEIAGSFTIDIDDLRAGITQANRLMRLANSEFQAATAGMDGWANSADGLTAKQRQLNAQIDIQKQKVSAMQQEYDRVAQELGENSAEAQNLQIRINQETAALNRNQAQLERVNRSLEEMENGADDAGGAAEDLAENETKAAKAGNDAGKATESLGKKAKAAAVGGIKALAAAAAGLVTSFFASAEATRDYRTEMGKLETAFTSAGKTTEAAKKTYEELYAFMGEEDTAVEAANHLAKLVDNEKDLQKWTNIATGVFATFGDSLPIEGLTEAANETAKVGQVTGPLADALNWAGVSEDKFNESLAACSTEQERQALITDTLNGIYKDASETYKEVNKDVMAANMAQSKLNDSMARVGDMAEPVMTVLKTKAAEALDKVVDLFDGFDKVLSKDMSLGEYGAQVIDRLATSFATGAPKLLETGTKLLDNIGTGLKNGMPVFLSNGITFLDGLVTKIREGAGKLVDSGMQLILNLGQGLANSFPVIWEKLPGLVSNIAGIINDNAPKLLKTAAKLILTLATGLIKSIPTLVKNIPKIIKAIVDVFTAFQWLKLGKSIIDGLKNGIIKMKDSIKASAGKIKDAVVNAIKALPGNLLNIGKMALKKIASVLKGASGIKDAAKRIATVVVNGVKALPGKLIDIGVNVVKGLWNGINNAKDWVIGKIKGFGDAILSGIKDFFGIHSPSKVMEGQVGKQLALGVAQGITKNTKYAKKSAAKLGSIIVEAAQKRLERYKVYHDMTLTEEKAFWDEIRHQTKKGTAARLEADKNYFEAKKQLNEQKKAAEQSYTESVSQAYKDLQNDIKSVIDAYQNEVQARAKAIADSVGLFDEFQKNVEISGQQLIDNLKGQVTGMQAWKDALDELEEKGVDSAFLQELREMGVGAAGEVDALNSLTAEQLDEYVALWKEKNQIATDAAKKELSDLQTETISKITELVANTKSSIAGYKKTYEEALKELGVAVKKQIKNTDKTLAKTAAETILETAPGVGSDMVDGIISGLDSKSGSLYRKISSIITGAITAAQQAAEIASPSKVMRDLIGKNLVRGTIVGIEAESGNLYKTMRGVMDNTTNAAGDADMSNMTQTGQAAGTIVYFTQNNTSPKALSPYEVYRQTKLANKMILGGR